MGAYLSEPVTQKISEDVASDKKHIICGSSSMQGWRNSQEDAHNAILDLDNDTAYFAVYDGHGGSEVSAYCAYKLPDFLVELEAYKNGELKKALVDSFLGFDELLTRPNVVKELKIIAGSHVDSADEEEDEEVAELYQEATMSLDELLKKYAPKTKDDDSESNNLPKGRIQIIKGQSKRKPASPVLRPKGASRTPLSDNAEEVSSSAGSSNGGSGSSSSGNEASAESNGEDHKCSSASNSGPEAAEPPPAVAKEDYGTSKETESKSSSNGDTGNLEERCQSETEKSLPRTPSIKGKGKGKGKSKVSTKTSEDIGEVEDLQPVVEVEKLPTRVSPRKAKELYDSVVGSSGTNGTASTEDSESDESDDDDFNADNDGSDNSSDDAVNGGSEDDDDSEDYETVDEEEEEEMGDDEEEEDTAFLDTMKHEPGNDSGCTAVVALLRGKNLYVANAGDSRAVLCRGGKAVDLSEDHKPEDLLERNRITKAGGVVTAEGRVNGGLNLSRAIGDHGYKQNKALSPEEQMITALPDVVHKELDPNTDEFIILACDGIWNSMTSQEVVDFIRERIKKGEQSMSRICEALFDSCIAPNTHGDGTGCDNMTAIIVQLFKDPPSPRKVTPVPEPSQTSQEGEVVHLKDVLHDSSTNDTNYTEDNSTNDQDFSEDTSDRKRSGSPVEEEGQQKRQKTE